jgi:hypothetical protein
MERDTANAVALGMVIGGLLMQPEDKRPREWQDIGWDQIVGHVNLAAEALDEYQTGQPEDFWDEFDWYLTLDAIAAELWQDPTMEWTAERVKALMVRI